MVQVRYAILTLLNICRISRCFSIVSLVSDVLFIGGLQLVRCSGSETMGTSTGARKNWENTMEEADMVRFVAWTHYK